MLRLLRIVHKLCFCGLLSHDRLQMLKGLCKNARAPTFQAYRHTGSSSKSSGPTLPQLGHKSVLVATRDPNTQGCSIWVMGTSISEYDREIASQLQDITKLLCTTSACPLPSWCSSFDSSFDMYRYQACGIGVIPSNGIQSLCISKMS